MGATTCRVGATTAVLVSWGALALSAVLGPAPLPPVSISTGWLATPGVVEVLARPQAPGRWSTVGPRRDTARHAGAVVGVPVVDVPAAEPITGRAVAATVGQLLAQDESGRRRLCSATLVASQSKSVVVTAAHCVYTPPQIGGATIAPPGQRGWVASTQFVPGADGREQPFGVWEVEEIAVDPRWQTDGDPVHDVAFLRLAARDGQLAGDVLGAQGIGEAPAQPPGPLSAVGYPAAGEFTGDEVLRCAADQPGVEAALGGDYTLPCDMTEGSSGGPWLAELDENTGLGVVQAVTSLRVVGDERIAGARLGPDAMTLFAAVDQQPDRAQRAAAAGRANPVGGGGRAARPDPAARLQPTVAE